MLGLAGNWRKSVTCAHYAAVCDCTFNEVETPLPRPTLHFKLRTRLPNEQPTRTLT